MSAIDDYLQLIEKGSPLNNAWQQLKSNINKNIPTQADLESPQRMVDWSTSAALNSPMIGAIKTWHGSPHKFTKFEEPINHPPEYYKDFVPFGKGIYSTEDVEYAKQYAKPSGYLYKLNLKPDHEDLLNLDKLASGQSPKISESLKGIPEVLDFIAKYPKSDMSIMLDNLIDKHGYGITDKYAQKPHFKAAGFDFQCVYVARMYQWCVFYVSDLIVSFHIFQCPSD